MWMTGDPASSGGMGLSRTGWGQDTPSSPAAGRRRHSGNLSPAHQQLVPTVVPSWDGRTVAVKDDLKATRTVIVRSVSPDPEEEVRLEGIRCPRPERFGRLVERLGGLGGRASRAWPAALTPGFTGPYYRGFGAVFAPGLSLPSTLTGLRESSA
jgi:hypothetical protein